MDNMQKSNVDVPNVLIKIEDKFDFSFHQFFKQSYINCKDEGTVFTIDLSDTSYMDSSALGMILLLKDYADNLKGQVVIKKPSVGVKKILEIAQFHRLLTIEG